VFPSFLLIFAIAILVALRVSADASQPTAVTVFPAVVPEGRDFATWVLADPWDMDQFSDVSQYINESGVAIHLQNIQVAEGIFSAQSVGDDAQFYTLFPGYQSAINAGKVGARYPIDTSVYQCLYMRMRVDSDTSDDIRIFWFADNRLALGPHGVTYGINHTSNKWAIYTANLELMTDHAWSDQLWAERSEWQGLRIDPTKKPGVNFYVDWVRLTDCNPVTTTLAWTPVAEYVEIWAGIDQTSPDFKVSDVWGSDGSYILDVQGWEPGTYYLGIKDSSGLTWSANPLKIDPAPRSTFIKPSFDSGESLRWEMDTANDVADARCIQHTFQGGVLDLVTLPPAALPPECVAGGPSDPRLILTVPTTPVDTTQYRYLTVRIYTEGPWQDVNNGWMMRWIWKTYENGNPNQWCYNVSNDIPFDRGWDTLAVDLHDAFEGLTEDYAGGPFCHHRNWSDDPTDYLRLDPNENTTALPLHQQLDWIRLSRMDRTTQGSLFPIKLKLSESMHTLSFDFYYTTDRSDPRQHPATIFKGNTSAPPASYDHHIYLPLVQARWPSQETVFLWDTTAVSTGEYYICVEVNDRLNTTLRCSEAPVEVYP
jgi:hypothetical protein